MTTVENDRTPSDERRREKRVTYTAILGFKEFNGRKIRSFPPKPNAAASNLSFTGMCFISKKRPKSELLIVYLPDGARAVVRVVAVKQHDDPTKLRIHCKFVEWLPDGATTLASPKGALI